MVDFEQSLHNLQISDILASENRTIDSAKFILKERLYTATNILNCPETVLDFAIVHFSGLQREVFSLIYLNNAYKCVGEGTLFEGTTAHVEVYPREVIREALKYNATAVILIHNHPSGSLSISDDDKKLTRKLDEALKCVDVTVVDHIIVGAGSATSFSQQGLIRCV